MRETHASFLARLELKHTPEDIALIDFAYDMSKYGHRNQLRDDGGRYFDHCRASTIILIDELGITDKNMIIGELLHDSVEDHYLLSVPRIELVFGRDVAGIVDALTHRNGEKEDEYIARIIDFGVRAIIGKLGDRLHNMRTLRNCTREKIERKLAETSKYYLPLTSLVKNVHPHIGQKLYSLLSQAMREVEPLPF
jgi:GTP pyrophosphokinase